MRIMKLICFYGLKVITTATKNNTYIRMYKTVEYVTNFIYELAGTGNKQIKHVTITWNNKFDGKPGMINCICKIALKIFSKYRKIWTVNI